MVDGYQMAAKMPCLSLNMTSVIVIDAVVVVLSSTTTATAVAVVVYQVYSHGSRIISSLTNCPVHLSCSTILSSGVEFCQIPCLCWCQLQLVPLLNSNYDTQVSNTNYICVNDCDSDLSLHYQPTPNLCALLWLGQSKIMFHRKAEGLHHDFNALWKCKLPGYHL